MDLEALDMLPEVESGGSVQPSVKATLIWRGKEANLVLLILEINFT